MTGTSREAVGEFKKIKDFLIADYLTRKAHLEQNIKEEQHEEISLRTDGPLVVKSATFDRKDRETHHTTRYQVWGGQNPTPVYRRCEPFHRIVKFNRDFDSDKDVIQVLLNYTFRVNLKLPAVFTVEEDNNQWTVQILKVADKSVTLKIKPPVICQVGLWTIQISTSLKSTIHENFGKTDNIYIICNPWCQYDEVYLENDKERKAYVLEDHADIYHGTSKAITTRPWIFGQFDFSVLPAVIMLLENCSRLAHTHRGSATLISRELSQVINNVGPSFSDNGGLLEGRWSGYYQDGTEPTNWTGSIAIFDQYLHTKGRTVKYGQCWVFAGCLATACRVLGIPCRTITCFNSAHDTHKNLKIDFFPNTADSIWNYHIWNEVWLSRPDLPKDYGGWQVIDGTPQELSDGTFQLGPASRKAIKEGELGLKYDVQFVFTELNADTIYYNGDAFASSDIKAVGDLIGTFDIDNKRHMRDVTLDYKYAEGSTKEREIYRKALAQVSTTVGSRNEKPSPDEYPREVYLKLEEIRSVVFGEPFSMVVDIFNTSDDIRAVQASLNVTAVEYTGEEGSSVKTGEVSVTLQPNSKTEAKLDVAVQDYKDKLRYISNIKMAVVSTVQETKEVYALQQVFEVVSPKLTVKITSEIISLGSVCNFEVSFKNPLDEELTNCTLAMEGTYFLRPTTTTLANVPANGVMFSRHDFEQRTAGLCTLSCIFWCKQLGNVIGSVTFTVDEY